MDGIIGGLLGYLQDPRRTQQVQGIGNALEKGLLRLQESDKRFKELADRAFDPKNPGRIKDKEALKELTDMTMTGLLGFAPAGLTVFHGSPAKFKQFDPTKIGSGEGAQAYGYGHYVAESPDVAKSYQTILSADKGFTFEGKSGLTRAEVQDLVNKKYGSKYLDGVIKPSGVADSFIDDMLTGVNRQEGSYPRQYKEGSERAKIYDELRGKIQHSDKGAIYKIDLPDEQIAKMLDWDKPLSEQPQVVKDALIKSGLIDFEKNIGLSPSGELRDLGWSKNVGSLRGEELYRRLIEKQFSPARGATTEARKISESEAAEILRQAGIPGIRYLDQGSRGVGQGTSNFVVFPGNEDLLRILERNNTPLGLLD